MSWKWNCLGRARQSDETIQEMVLRLDVSSQGCSDKGKTDP